MPHPCAIPGRVEVGPFQHGLDTVRVTAAGGQAELVLAGATLVSFVPAGGRELLWTSPRSPWQVGKAIRGGVPLCWPWFGPHAGDPAAPAHGVARLQAWELVESAVLHDGSVAIELALPESPAVRAAAGPGVTARLRLRVGREVTLALTTSNAGPAAVTVSDALHTYFAVADARRTVLRGLAGAPYRDKVRGMAFAVQAGELALAGPTDRVHQPCAEVVELDDGERRIRIAKHGAGACVVWNPWSEKAPAEVAEHWPGFVCVEAANAFESALHLPPGTSHTTVQTFAVLA